MQVFWIRPPDRTPLNKDDGHRPDASRGKKQRASVEADAVVS
jgi:hypothetical protein